MFLIKKIWLAVLASLFINSTALASTLLVMGDSLSAAYNLRPESGWVSLLEDHFSESDRDITIINASVSGETTQGGLSRFEQIITEHNPRWVILELGANDALRGYPLDQTRDNLESMITQAQAANANVLLIGNRIPLNYGKRYTEMFFNLYSEIAEKHQIATMPFMLKDVALNKDLMQEDGIHPNKEGQVIIFENILPYITSLTENANAH